MNAEKELLLKLLMEKYGQPEKVAEPTSSKKYKRNRIYSEDHKWTAEEKATLLRMRNDGYGWDEIADVLGLRPNQCRSMFSNLPVYGKRVN
jgi:hypothetical protein